MVHIASRIGRKSEIKNRENKRRQIERENTDEAVRRRIVKRKRKWMIALGFLILVCGGYMAVSAGNEAAVSNHISTGIIDIELEEHQIKNG